MKVDFLKTAVLLMLIIINIDAKELEKVSLQLQWLGQFQFAGYYMAKEKGFYKEQGLDVDILPYEMNMDVVQSVLDKRATYATGRSSLVIDCADGKDVVAVAAIFQSSPMVLLVRDDGVIKSPEDLKNRRIMMTNDAASSAAFQAMLRSVGIKDNQYNVIEHSFDPFSLERNETDAISSYLSNEPYQLQEKNYPYKIIYPKDYGFDFYSDILFTRASELQNNPLRVAKFREASLRGWRYAFDHIQESAMYIYKHHNPQHKSLKSLIFEGRVLKKLAYQDGIELGHIDKDRLKRIEQIYRLIGLIKGKSKALRYYQDNDAILSEKENLWLKEHTHISVGVDPHWPPISFINERGKYIGVNANYLKLMSQKLGVQFEINRDRLYSLDDNVTDFFSISHRALLDKNMDKYNSYMQIPSVIIAKRDITYVASLADISDKKVVMIRDDIHIHSIKKRFPRLNITFATDMKKALEMVADEEFDYLIGSLATASYYMDMKKFNNLKVVGKAGYSYRLGFIAKNKILNSIIQKTVKSISKEELDTIYQKWNTTTYEKEYDYTLLWQGLAFFSVLLLIVFYKNRELDRTVKIRTQELQELNNSLNERIKEAVEEIHVKEHMIIHQTKMASLGEMLESIAHQWRQPLNISSLSLSKLEMEYQLGELKDETIETTIKQISQQINYMSDTIDDFRNFFKTDKELVEIRYDKFMQEIVTLVQKGLLSRNITLNINYNSSIELNIYANELKQVVLNIINNAKDAILENEAKLKKIDINVKIVDNFCCISICDSGGGIKEENIERIFEPYFTTKFESQGTGIGLYMAKNIIEKNIKGKIVAYNQDLGACFEIYIPLKRD
jgi:signal transduction histidine kinase/ABC-type nitrate/sulfonate/bicarbonate transport system substrate-binding protein